MTQVKEARARVSRVRVRQLRWFVLRLRSVCGGKPSAEPETRSQTAIFLTTREKGRKGNPNSRFIPILFLLCSLLSALLLVRSGFVISFNPGNSQPFAVECLPSPFNVQCSIAIGSNARLGVGVRNVWLEVQTKDFVTWQKQLKLVFREGL